mmetsp:Transcript_22574/g.29562  ORF Transcript_22574/g.29562 Transcript_22574/m.29562 type:complete len:800 (+) Transcript_22574:336-2735(+)
MNFANEDIHTTSVGSTELEDGSNKVTNMKSFSPKKHERLKKIKEDSKANYAAAITLQKAYRGYSTRREVMFVPVHEVKKMIKDLERKHKGFQSCFHMVFFLVVYFVVIVQQRNLMFSSSVKMSLMAVTEGYDEVTTIAGSFQYLRQLAYELYDGNQEESHCNTCEYFSQLTQRANDFDTVALCEPCAMNWTMEGCEDCLIFAPCYGEPCDSFQATLNSSITKDGNIVDASMCADVDYMWNIGLTKFMRNMWVNESVGLEGRGWLANKNRVFGGPVFTFNLYENTTCEDPLDSGLGSWYHYCASDELVKFINIADTPAMEPYGAFLYHDALDYDEDMQSFVWLIDIGLFNAGLNYMMCVFHALEATGLFATQTESLGLVLPVYNGQQEGMFTLIRINFKVDHGGKVTASRFIKSFPIREMYSSRDRSRVALEVILVICMILNLIDIGKQIFHRIKTAKQVLVQMKDASSLKSGDSTDSIVWLIAQICLQVSIMAQIVVWLNLVDLMKSYSLALPSDLGMAGLKTIIELVTQLTQHSLILDTYDNLAVSTAVFSVFLVFKALKFHKQVSLITDTLTKAMTDLIHFLVIFLFVHFLFSAIMWIMVGSQLEDYKTLSSSLSHMLLVTFGSFDFEALANANDVAPYVFFFFEFLVTLLLFNILLSIMIDAYEGAKSAAASHEEPLLESLFHYCGRNFCFCRNGLQRIFRLCMSCKNERTFPGAADSSGGHLVSKYSEVKDIIKDGFNYSRRFHGSSMSNSKLPSQDLVHLKVAKEALVRSPCLNITAIRYLRRRKAIVKYKDTT